MSQFATEEDFQQCRQWHKRFGTSYYFATKFFPPHLRQATHSVYAFVRVPDEWVDNPTVSPSIIRQQLSSYRSEFEAGLNGKRPANGVLRAFCDTVLRYGIPAEEPKIFLDCMEMDLDVDRYESYDDLRTYMRGSAAAIGVMMTYLLAPNPCPAAIEGAVALGEAMQLTNFIRDVGEDSDRGRIYLPMEDLRRFGVSPESILDKRFTPEFGAMLSFQITRARSLYSIANANIGKLPKQGRNAVRIASMLYSAILDKVEAQGNDVFAARARTGRLEKIWLATRAIHTQRSQNQLSAE
jgi:phytoene synthase